MPMKWHCTIILSTLCFSSCSDNIDRGSKAVYPVSGIVTVDGQPPGEVIQIGVHYSQGLDAADPSTSSGLTNKDGTFALNTYTQGDGVPIGEYTLTFTWKTFNQMSMSYTGEDKLNGRYDDVESSEVKFKVDGSGPVDLGIIALTTK